MKSVILKDGELIERMNDEELEKFRSWLKRLIIKEPTPQELNREAVRRHREKYKPPGRKNLKPELGKIHRCGVELTDYNSYYNHKGQLKCRKCDLIKAKRYALKRMTQNFYRNLSQSKRGKSR